MPAIVTKNINTTSSAARPLSAAVRDHDWLERLAEAEAAVHHQERCEVETRLDEQEDGDERQVSDPDEPQALGRRRAELERDLRRDPDQRAHDEVTDHPDERLTVAREAREQVAHSCAAVVHLEEEHIATPVEHRHHEQDAEDRDDSGDQCEKPCDPRTEPERKVRPGVPPRFPHAAAQIDRSGAFCQQLGACEHGLGRGIGILAHRSSSSRSEPILSASHSGRLSALALAPEIGDQVGDFSRCEPLAERRQRAVAPGSRTAVDRVVEIIIGGRGEPVRAVETRRARRRVGRALFDGSRMTIRTEPREQVRAALCVARRIDRGLGRGARTGCRALRAPLRRRCARARDRERRRRAPPCFSGPSDSSAFTDASWFHPPLGATIVGPPNAKERRCRNSARSSAKATSRSSR